MSGLSRVACICKLDPIQKILPSVYNASKDHKIIKHTLYLNPDSENVYSYVIYHKT